MKQRLHHLLSVDQRPNRGALWRIVSRQQLRLAISCVCSGETEMETRREGRAIRPILG